MPYQTIINANNNDRRKKDIPVAKKQSNIIKLLLKN